MMDNSIISTSLYTIALYFDSLENSMWAVLAYTLSYLGEPPAPSEPDVDIVGQDWN